MIIIRRIRHKNSALFQKEFAQLRDPWDNWFDPVRDPWDDWFDPEKINRTIQDQQVPASTRFLNPGVDTDPSPRPQSPNTTSNSKTVAKSGKLNSKAVLAGLAAASLAGAGAYFIRRRKSKKGKTIIERVRR